MWGVVLHCLRGLFSFSLLIDNLQFMMVDLILPNGVQSRRFMFTMVDSILLNGVQSRRFAIYDGRFDPAELSLIQYSPSTVTKHQHHVRCSVSSTVCSLSKMYQKYPSCEERGLHKSITDSSLQAPSTGNLLPDTLPLRFS